MGQLPPHGNFSFSGLPQEHLTAVFSKLFPLKTPYAQCFECCEANPILDSFEVFSLGWVEECKLGMSWLIPQKLSTTKWGTLKSGFWVQRHVMLSNSPLSLLSRKREQVSGSLLLAWIKWSCPFFHLMWQYEHRAPSESAGKLLLPCTHNRPLLKCYCRTFPRVMSEVWLWFSHDGNTLHVCCKVTD